MSTFYRPGQFVRFVYGVIAVITLGVVLFFREPIGRTLWHAEGNLFWVLSIFSLRCLLGGIYSILTISYLDFFGVRPFILSIRRQFDKQPGLFTKGPYAYCCHPRYLFFGLAGFSEPVMFYGNIEFLLISAIYVTMAIPLEKGNLRKDLGDIYDIYRLNVPKVFPRCSPWEYKPQEPSGSDG
ncbi:MAG: hypothetical protein ABGZ19_00030 [Verrucomicrobiales bacterium]